MVEGKKKSRSLKRTVRKTPSGKVKTHYKRRKPSAAKCAECKEELQGISRLRSAKLRNLPKCKRTVARPFGGNLCTSCTRNLIKQKAR